jgi:hypothetical protein
VLLTGPFGGLTDDVREFLRCLAADGLALARRRTALLRSLCDAGRLTEAEAGLLQLTDLGREFLDLPEAAQLGFVFAAWWEGVDWGEWAPSPLLPSPQPLPTNPTAQPRRTMVLAGWAVVSHPVGSVPPNSDPVRKATCGGLGGGGDRPAGRGRGRAGVRPFRPRG